MIFKKCFVDFQGDMVMVTKSTNPISKNAGPYRILEKISSNAYVLELQ